MKSKEFAARTGLSLSTLRYYERQGLLKPARDGHGYRDYGERDLDWVGFILKLKEMAVPLAQIKEYARLRHRGDSTIPTRYELLRAHQAVLEQQRRQLESHWAFLEKKLVFYRERLARSD